RWWGRAAEKNDPGAQYNLGAVYLHGQSVAADAARALYWFKRAAERGHLLAQTNLGLAYLDGRGTTRDDILGAMWLTVAARRGEEGARDNLKRFGERLSPAVVEEANKRAAPWLKKFAALN